MSSTSAEHQNGGTSDETESLPLQNTWCIWHDKFTGNASAEKYEASLKKLCTFSTIQEFWQCFNNLPAIDCLAIKSSFHMMKEGIKPLWEDPANAQGGVWVLRINKADAANIWRELAMAAVGEQFSPVLSRDASDEENDDICGISISVRMGDYLLQIWNRNAQGNTQEILDKVRSLIPPSGVRATPFYKPSQAHDAFGKAK